MNSSEDAVAKAAPVTEAGEAVKAETATEGVTPDVNPAAENAVQNQNETPAAETPAAETGAQPNEQSTEEPDEQSDKESGKQSSETAPEAEKPHGFASLGLPDHILEAVVEAGYENPSPIQERTIPLLIEGRDVVGLAQTGTGKTAAFALPILSHIDPSQRSPQALVLAPTRELALQVAEACIAYAHHMPDVTVLPIYGGQAYGVQLAGLRRGAQIIVGTPGRVIDHLRKGTLDLTQLKMLVLDEADEMLKMGFQEDVETILAETPSEKQVALFSATMPRAIRRISGEYLRSPVEITVKSETTTNTNITQRYVVVQHRAKLDALTRILEVESFDAMIMFVRTKQATEELAERLRARGFNAAAIHGDIAQAQRERTIDQLKDGRLDILVATDVAARGLDVERISHVVNYDIPHDTESYVHRIGRTGRAGRSGQALLFVTHRERRMLRSIEKATRQELTEISLPTLDDVNEIRVQRFNESIAESLKDDNLELFRRLVKDFMEEHGTDPVDVAAALATQSRNSGEFLLTEDAVAQQRDRGDRRERGGRDGRDGRDGDRGDRRGRERGGRDRQDRGPRVSRSGEPMTAYRLAVGKRHRINPGSIVGALANEGGLSSDDIGHISIRPDHTLVDLPENLDPAVLDRLSDTRISGQLIDIEPDLGPPGGARGGRGGRGGFSGDRGERGDRHGRGDRFERNDRGARGYRDDRSFGGPRKDRGDRFDRNDRGNGKDRGNRGGRDGRREGDHRGNRGGGFRGRSHGDRW